MNEIRFASKEQEYFFFSMLKRNRTTDTCYHAFAYCVGISEMTRDNIHRIFDFDRKCIKPEDLHEGWQTGGSVRLTRLAFNLWNGYAEKGKERMSTPYELFDCGYAPYLQADQRQSCQLTLPYKESRGWRKILLYCWSRSGRWISGDWMIMWES